MTLINPIIPGHVALLRLTLYVSGRIPALGLNTFRALSFVHFARWSIIERFPYNGPPQRPEKLKYSYLLFQSNYNGDRIQYLDAFGNVLGVGLDRIGRHTFHFPRGSPPAPLKSHIVESDSGADHYYSAYPEASATMVLSALELRRRFGEFSRVASDLDAEELAAAYRDFITDCQRLL